LEARINMKKRTDYIFIPRFLMKTCVLICVFVLSGTNRASSTEMEQTYSIILVNSFNQSDFEVRMMYSLMNGIAEEENILVLTVPPYYADAVETLGVGVKQTILDNFLYQLNTLIPSINQATISRAIAIGRHASFFLDTNPDLLGDAERFFLHIDWSPQTGTLVPSDYSATASFKQILSMFPDTKEIAFVYGSLDLKVDKALVNNFISSAPEGIEVRYFNPMRYPDETLRELTNFKKNTPVIYINYKYFERGWESVHNWLVQQERHPVFTIFAHNVDRYAGGAVVVPEKLAATAIAIARGYEVSLSHNNVISQQYNAQQLSRWGVDKSALPSDAVLVNEKSSVFSSKVVFSIVSVLMAIILLLTLFTLYRARIHSKKMGSALMDADSANRSKSEFLANMSHEIRTPMNGVLGTLQILERTASDKKSRELIDKAIYSARTLLTIINDILDYSKIESNKLTLEEKPFSMQKVVESVVDDLSHIAEEKGVQLTTEVSEDYSDGWDGDAVRVRQITLNLVSNAVKFTRRGSVTIKLSNLKGEEGDNQICLTVTDTGIGMSQEAQQSLFERFTQADTSTTRRFGGTGLGMSITLSLVNLMHGKITVDSEEGVGTKISVTLPLRETSLTKNDLTRSTSELSVPVLGHMNILIAEDNAINRTIVESMLSGTGAFLKFVEDGEQAVKAFEQRFYDVVLMDIQMPVMDGVEACNRIVAMRPDACMIALTADVMPEHIARYEKAGFTDYIGKPIEINKLYQTLEAIQNDRNKLETND
jgi:signal transduction histidine kinase/CheY-like chemotaxis protein